MTIREKIESTLVDHGLWDNEAKTVVNEVEQSLEAMSGRWDEDISGYPSAIISATWMFSKDRAVEWLKANHPQHFALHILAE